MRTAIYIVLSYPHFQAAGQLPTKGLIIVFRLVSPSSHA